MRASRREIGLDYVVLVVAAVVALTPLVGILLSALTPADQAGSGFAVPKHLAFGNFSQAWAQGRFDRYMLNSVAVAAGVVVLTTLMCLLAGYAFATMHFPGRTVLFYVMLLGLMVPSEGFVITLYYDLRGLGLTNTYWSLLLPQTAQSLAFGTFWMRNHFRSVPVSVLEAARLDGASERHVLWRVLLPTATPAITTMGLLVAMWTWNEFLLPLVMISGDDLRTAPLGLAFFQGQHVTDTHLLAAASTLVALPIVVLYLLLQRKFLAGMLAGGDR